MNADSIVVLGATLLRGVGLDPIAGADVAVSGTRIREIRTGGHARPEGAAATIDATGLTLLPGFIDAHVHIGFATPEEVLRHGVTTARDLGWPSDAIQLLVARSRSDDFNGPTLVAAGPIVTAVGGYPTRAGWAPPGTGLEVSGIADARRAVAGLADDGVHVIKVALHPGVGPTLDRPTLSAIVDEAHARSLKVTGHVHGLGELEKALDAGMDELAHMLMSPESLPEPIIDRMVEAGMAVVPTLSIFRGRPRRVAIENLRRFRDAGGTIVYGTDLGNAGPQPGIDKREVEAMAEAGMDGREIVAAGTTRSASWLGLDVGVLEVGRTADIVGVAGDPLSDPRHITDVRMVIRRGKRVR